MSISPITTRLIDLPDGRKIGLSEYGDPEGTPIFYLHGCHP